MSDLTTDLPDPRDPLDDMLAAPPVADDERLRRAVFDRTARALRGRRLRRRLAVAALAACVVAALLGAWWWRTGGQPEVARRPEAPTPPAPAPTPPEELVPSPVALEWRAFDSTDHKAELYHEAGDRYLNETSDPGSALRCYGQSLDAGTNADLAHSPDDSWLLMLIKDAREKEKDHAKNGN